MPRLLFSKLASLKVKIHVVNKLCPMKLEKILIPLLFLLTLPLIAQDPTSYLGAYRYHSDDEDGVSQSVGAVILQHNGSAIKISITVTWVPGSALEIEATVPLDQVKTVTIDTRDCTEIGFSFTDSFKNAGVAKMSICGDTASLTLDETAIAESKGVRQYGDYQLTKQP